MIVYSGTKGRFRQDVMTNDIGGIIFDTFKGVTGRNTPRNQILAWTNSLQYMDRVIADPAIPEDAGVAIELCAGFFNYKYKLPSRGRR